LWSGFENSEKPPFLEKEKLVLFLKKGILGSPPPSWGESQGAQEEEGPERMGSIRCIQAPGRGSQRRFHAEQKPTGCGVSRFSFLLVPQ
jgi:hypothetical protein